MPDLSTAQLAWTDILRQSHGGTFSDSYDLLPIQFYSAVMGWEVTVGSSVSAEAVKGTAGIVPLRVAWTRIAHDNPSLALAVRQGNSGGLTWIPLALAKSLNVDPRFPWSSLYVLLVRLRAIAEYRLLQYATMWDNVLNGRELSDRDSQFFTRSALLENADAAATILAGVPRLGYTEVVSAGQGADIDWELPGHVGSLRLRRPSNWPWCLALEEGFWRMVLLEERANGNDRVGKLWDYMVGQGLPWFLSGPNEGNTLVAGAALVQEGRIFVRSPYAKASGVLSDSAAARAAGLTADDIALLSGHMGAVDTMFARVPFNVEEVRSATLNVPVERYNGTVFPWTSETETWSGAVGQFPGVPVEPEVGHDSPFVQPEERKSSWLLPAGILVGCGLLGLYLWRR